ncbi:hypothetical protein [Nitrosomonas sp.]|uniref:hypothetical protein n=1 Tax=Nitrosomonas sp. TaxID=42353 RepID=UPI001DB5BCAE|nr:hypothetical protein [Nitrosomonas sp.]MBX3616551.1 hypothetical protein [Nitrosomonas sp.]
MSINLRKYFTVLPLLSLLVACAQMGPLDVQNADINKLAQHAKTHNDHEKLASYYDDVAEEMREKVVEKRKALQHYENKSHYYGRRGQDFHSHTTANLRYYEQAAKEAQKQAYFHRRIAAELLQRENAKPVATPGQLSDHANKAELDSDPDKL